MEIIKYKAWDKYKSIMYDPMPIIDFHLIKINAITLRRFTGLKDKNGVEIFEGDIIKDSDRVYEIRFGSYFIEWEHIGFYMWGYGEAGPIGEGDQGVIEIIGNIYENPDFIKND